MDVEQGASETVHLDNDDDGDFLPDLDKSFAAISIDPTNQQVQSETVHLDDDEMQEFMLKDESAQLKLNKNIFIKKPSNMHTIKVKLNTIIANNDKSRDFFSFIKAQVPICSKLTAEAWDLTNYYVLDCLKNGRDIIPMNHEFFKQCFRLLTWSERTNAKFEGEYVHLKEAFNKFKSSRIDPACYPESKPPQRNRNGVDDIFTSIATEMETAFKVMIKKTFKFRLKKWLNFENDYGSDTRTRYKALNEAVLLEYDQYKDALFGRKRSENDDKKDKTVNKSFEANRTKLTKLLRKLFEIQQAFEIVANLKYEFYASNKPADTKVKRISTMNEHEKRRAKKKQAESGTAQLNKKKKVFTFKDKKSYQIKGIKNFCLTPHKKGFKLNYITLSKTSINELVTNRRFKTARYAPNPDDFVLASRKFLVKISNVFTDNLFSDLFDFNKFLIPNSKYRINEIMSLATDGVSANILLTTNEVTNGQITHKANTNKFTKKDKRNEIEIITVDPNIKQRSESTRRKELGKSKLKVPLKFNHNEYAKKDQSETVDLTQIERIVGIDQGAKTLITAYGLFEDYKCKIIRNNNKQLLREPFKNNCDKSVRELLEEKNPDKKFNQRIFSYSTKQYYHESKVNEKIRVAKVWLIASSKYYSEKLKLKSHDFISRPNVLEELKQFLDNEEDEDEKKKIIYNSTTDKKRKKEIIKLKNKEAAFTIYKILFKNKLTADHLRAINKFESIDAIFKKMPSFKTGNISEYKIYLEYLKKHEDVLLKYYSVNTSRKWNFTTYSAKQQVYDRIHQVFKNCTLGYGNYSQPGSSKIRFKSKYK
jgi:hypothetical protein